MTSPPGANPEVQSGQVLPEHYASLPKLSVTLPGSPLPRCALATPVYASAPRSVCIRTRCTSPESQAAWALSLYSPRRGLRRSASNSHGARSLRRRFDTSLIRTNDHTLGNSNCSLRLPLTLRGAPTSDLRGRHVIHYIDNTSAVAALVKGYSRAPDSARMLHAFTARRLALGTDIWFQWVASAANIADWPSPGDMVTRCGFAQWARSSAAYASPLSSRIMCPSGVGRGKVPRVAPVRPSVLSASSMPRSVDDMLLGVPLYTRREFPR